MQRGRNLWIAAFAALVVLAFPALALAHIERPSYWPDPNPDCAVTPCAGGAVPQERSLESAVTGAGPGNVLVVCQGKNGKDSLQALHDSLKDAQKNGYRLRPSQPKTTPSVHEINDLRKINHDLAKLCAFDSVQQAVFAAGNNDRIVIMPGHYTEPASRSAPKNDPRCTPSLLQETSRGAQAPSYRYHAVCPNDQSLIHVLGRAVVGDPPEPPFPDRRGIPAQELGACLRCNLQIEGSGVKPEDVILDGGTNYQSTTPDAKPGGYAKDVVLRVDRADGFVGRNFLMRGALEHGFYTEETDGVLLDRVKFFWAADYGHLSFTSDHNVVENCEGFGAGDSVVYPGAAPETGAQSSSFWPDAPRINTVIRDCDLHGSALGYSGSMGNNVRITHNHIYGNTTGISSDTLSAGGHPGFPADGSEIDHNFIYSNNLNLYVANPPVAPTVGVPIGTGIIYAGMNDARVHDNWIFDNWRNGAMLLTVPDVFTSTPEGTIFPGISCPGAPASGISTSCNNHYFNNNVGRAPNGFRYPSAVDLFGNPHADNAAAKKPNGIDFWWDEFPTPGNCWFGNTGSDGTAASVTGPGPAGRLPGDPPQVLPADCATSVGPFDNAKLNYLIDCSEGPDTETGPADCDWWSAPSRPGG